MEKKFGDIIFFNKKRHNKNSICRTELLNIHNVLSNVTTFFFLHVNFNFNRNYLLNKIFCIENVYTHCRMHTENVLL